MPRLLLLLLLLCLPLLACAPDRRVGDDDDAADDDDASPDDDDASPDDDDSSSDDDDSVQPDVVVIDLSPEPDETGFYAGAPLWVRFSQQPTAVDFEVTGPDGSVPLSETKSSNGRVYTFVPVDGLEPDTGYEVTLGWAGADPVVYSFSTSQAGLPLDDPSVLIDLAFMADLAGATFVEPPGVGPIFQSQLVDIALLGDMDASSDLSLASQPGVQFVVAVGTVTDPVSGTVEVEECATTSGMTIGADGLVGTADDVPASFVNPAFELGPTDLDWFFQGTSMSWTDLQMSGVYTPDGEQIQGGALSFLMDTRPMGPELIPDGGEDSVCVLFEETVGVECEPCNDGEPFCLFMVITDIEAHAVPGLDLELITCVDILQDPACADTWPDYDEDADGAYELCPDYVP